MLFSPTHGSSGHSQSSRASAGVVVVVASLRFSPSLPLLQLLRVPNRHGRRCSAAVADLYLFVIFHPEVVLLSSMLIWSQCFSVCFLLTRLSQCGRQCYMACCCHGDLTWLLLHWLEVMHFHSVASFSFLGHCYSSCCFFEAACYHGNHTPP